MTGWWALVTRDVRRDFLSGNWWLPITFFLLVAMLYPFAVGPDAPLLVVPDVLQGLEAMGRAARARTGAKVIGVTGSVAWIW